MRRYHGILVNALLLFFGGKALAVDEQQIVRGEYIARVGDCNACHAASKNGKPFAGGYPLGTPLGVVYSTNITPRKQTGKGNWSYDEFSTPMRTRKTRKGRTVSSRDLPCESDGRCKRRVM